MVGQQHSGNTASLHQIKTKLKRFGLVLLVLAAFGLMLLGKADTILVEKAQILFNDITSPVLALLSKPAQAASRFMQNVHELVAIRQENARLREENQELTLVKLDTEQLRKENAYLADLLNYIPPPPAVSISSRVIADTGNSFAQSLIAFVGQKQKVNKGEVVLTGDGLVGRIASVGINAARILLITDINSRVPVKVEPLDTPAILSGDNTEYPQLISLPGNAKISVGDRVVTSGMAGVYPAGLPVGVIVSIDDGLIKVRPFFNRSRLEMVRIVDYGLSGLLPDPICAVSP
ncbi:MAG: rod shape-determining protein MreC [Alphaproteobacteria bacterium]|nr:rod shape-determining protein MreC [Alphaproteobacteria bacterium]